jgi:4-hydroxy-3-polyprenylbenzoate decarboxylase
VVADNVRPSTDVFLNHGPSDVLDHASYQFSYSRKLGIDATNKLDKIIEKKENSTTIEPKDFVYSPEIIFIKYLYEYNSLIVFVDTIKFTTANDTVNSLLQNEKYSNVKFLIILNSELKDNDLDILTWIGLANFDPAYDVNFFAHNKYNKVLVVNCLRKFNKMNFNRPWPNINVMDEITIKKIDDKWKSLSIGPFIDSPSHKIAHIEKTGGATVSDE